jgi:hypothetical protein
MSGANAWEKRRSDQIRSADELLEADPRGSSVVKVAAEWLRALLNEPDGPSRQNILVQSLFGLGSLPEYMRREGMAEWDRRFDALAFSEQPVMDPELLAAERVLGRAIGGIVGQDPNDRTFDLASSLMQIFYAACDAFLPAAEAAIASNPSAVKRLREMLWRRADDFTAAPRRAAYMVRANPCVLVRDYFDHAPLRDVWCNSPYFTEMLMRHPQAYALLLRLDPDAWLAAVERFPAPEPVKHIVQGCGVERDLRRLCLLIRAAGTPFGVDGSRRRENKVVFHLLKSAESLLALLSGPQDADGDAVAFEAACEDVVASFAGRPDVSVLGHAWLEELAWTDYATGTRRQHRARPGVMPDALARLVTAVGAVVTPLSDPLAWIKGSDDTWRGDRLLAVLAVLKGRQPPSVSGDLLTSVALGGLGNGIDPLLSDEATLAKRIVGDAVASLPYPSEWLRNLWRSSFGLRDRARHFAQRGQQASADVNALCLAWAVAGLERIDLSSTEARNLWIEIEASAREARLTTADVDVKGVAAKTQRRLALLWPSIFPDDPGPGAPGSLDDFVVSFAGPNREFASLILALDAAEVRIERIACAAGGRDKLLPLTAGVLDSLHADRRFDASDNASARLKDFVSRLRQTD